MRRISNQQGFGVLVVVLILAVIGIVGVVGYRLSHATDTATNAAVIKNSTVPEKINSKADLQKATNALDSTPVESGVDANSLDSEINALL